MDERLTKKQIEYLNIQKQNLTASDFETVLSYYGIEIQRKSILCPYHNDTHYGSCRILPGGTKAYCYVCTKSFNAVDLVMDNTGYSYPNALKYLWCNILGNSLPADEGKDGYAAFPLTPDELKFIGLPYYYGKAVNAPYGLCDRRDENPDKKRDTYDEKTGTCVLAKTVRVQSLFDLYEKDRWFILGMLYRKADDTAVKYWKMIDDLNHHRGMFAISYTVEEYNEYYKILYDYMRKARAIRSKVSYKKNKQNKHSYKNEKKPYR